MRIVRNQGFSRSAVGYVLLDSFGTETVKNIPLMPKLNRVPERVTYGTSEQTAAYFVKMLFAFLDFLQNLVADLMFIFHNYALRSVEYLKTKCFLHAEQG